MVAFQRICITLSRLNKFLSLLMFPTVDSLQIYCGTIQMKMLEAGKKTKEDAVGSSDINN